MNLSTIHQQRRYSLVALHQVTRLSELLGIDLHEPANQEVLRTVLAELIRAVSPQVSGIVVEPDYGLGQLTAKKSEAGILLPVQASTEEVDPLAVPSLAADWGIEQIANNYGVAYLELFYHPAEEHALLKKQMLAELMDYCQYIKIDLVLRLRIYSPHGEELNPEAFQAAQIQALQELQTMCHVFVLDSPGSVLAAATVTAELDKPWLIWLDPKKYEEQKTLLRTSVESGARGFMIGDSAWPELQNARRKDAGLDMTALKEFCKTTLRDRLIELNRIVTEEVV